jgi:hypothetical protein
MCGRKQRRMEPWCGRKPGPGGETRDERRETTVACAAERYIVSTSKAAARRPWTLRRNTRQTQRRLQPASTAMATRCASALRSAAPPPRLDRNYLLPPCMHFPPRLAAGLHIKRCRCAFGEACALPQIAAPLPLTWAHDLQPSIVLSRTSSH